MTHPADRLAQDRAVRDAAHQLFRSRIENLRDDLRERGIGRRVVAGVAREAREALDETLEIAGENKGVVAGTVIALILWLFRNPIVSMVQGLFDAGDDDPDMASEEEQP